FDTSLEITQSSNDDKEIKLEDLSKLVNDTGVEVMDLDTPKDDTPLLVLSEDEEDIKTETHTEIEDTLLTELLVNSLKPELAKLLTDRDFSASISIELKELPSKVNEINGFVGDLKKYMEKLELRFQLSKLKVLDALPNLLNKVVEASDRFKNVIDKASHKTGDESVPLAGQVGTHLADREKNTQQATITQLFQRRHAKDVANANLNKEPTIPKTTISISSITTTTALIIPTTLLFQFPFILVLQRPPLKLRGIKSWTKARKQCLMRKLLKKSLKVTLKLKSDLQRSNASLSQEDWSWVDYNLHSNETKARCPPPNKAKLELDLRKPLEE
ncbi:hypothetical protein Tco_0756027, partial [Tanacetum coccineum]